MSVSVDSADGFVDTNVLVYAYAVDTGMQHDVARELIRRLIRNERLVVSAQVLNEFYWVSTRPHRLSPLSHVATVAAISELALACDVVPLTEELTFRALDAMPKYGFSFWDALIWAAAKEHGADVIYTEDFQHDRVVEGVRFVNPFLERSAPQNPLD